MHKTKRAILPLLAVSLIGSGCGNDDTTEPEGPFDLTFQGDATFHAPHGGQTVTVAVVHDGDVVGTMTTTVSATADPAFSVAFAGVLEVGESYDVHYWIDSNFGGGTAGVCDAPPTDHQWSVSLPAIADDVTDTETHDATSLVDVCDTFAG